MRKIILFFFVLFFFQQLGYAQFFKGFGATLGGTASWQKWKDFEAGSQQRGKMIFWGNGALFAEMVDHEYYRWQTEFQWGMMGSKRTPVAPRVNLQYLSWGNYLKLRQELYDVTPYLLVGPKVAYLLNSSFPGFKQIHPVLFSALGMEFLYKRPLIWLVEVGYDWDITPAMKTDKYQARNNALILRAGVKWEIKKKARGCGPSRYRENVSTD
jgi:hypothetical protein